MTPPKTTAKNRLIPFTIDGDLHEWVSQPIGEDLPLSKVSTMWIESARRGKSVKWRPNHEFEARLQITDMERGRSAARFILTSEDGHRYPMFMSDMLTLTNRGIEPGGYSTGRWTFVKRGQNYGITPVVEDV